MQWTDDRWRRLILSSTSEHPHRLIPFIPFIFFFFGHGRLFGRNAPQWIMPARREVVESAPTFTRRAKAFCPDSFEAFDQDVFSGDHSEHLRQVDGSIGQRNDALTGYIVSPGRTDEHD